MYSFNSIADLFTHFDIPVPTDPGRFFCIHDPLKDLDDTVAQVAEAGLHHVGVVEIVGALGVLNPSTRRAQAIKGGFIELELPDIPVGVGSQVTDKEQIFNHETCSYLAPEDTVVNGYELLQRVLAKSNHDLHLVIAAGMTDIAVAMNETPDLVIAALRSVTIMGGVQVKQIEYGYRDDGFVVVKNKYGYMTPDNAANNEFDHEAAATVYRFCQEQRIPLTILTREAAYACQVTLGEFYSRMAATESPIGQHLVNAQAPSLRILYARCCEPEGSELRGKLPMRCDRPWFVNVFCGGNDPGDVEDIWPHVTAGQAYDLMAVLAAIPAIRDRFFAPVEVDVNVTTHRVIGLNKDWHNAEISDPDGLREFMHGLCVATLQQYQR